MLKNIHVKRGERETLYIKGFFYTYKDIRIYLFITSMCIYHNTLTLISQLSIQNYLALQAITLSKMK